MIQINPGEAYKIVRVLKDPFDSATHYVQAVFRKASDNTLLKSLNLTDKGSRVFIGSWDSPNPGYPLQVYVTTTVYDDASYTTVSPNYLVESDQFLIDQRWSLALGSGGGGGSAFDYKKIAEMINAAVREIALPAPKVTVNERSIDFKPLVAEIVKKIDGSISSMPRPEPGEKIDFKPVVVLLDKVIAAIDDLPKFEKTDLTGIRDAIAANHSELDGVVGKTISELKDAVQEILGAITKLTHDGVQLHLGAPRDPVSAVDHLARAKKLLNIS